ncbi:MAG: hypothetical protein VR68_07460 [Peptococcaceae bacterium BRH_c4a]|nr:MAG: hypothetical protein VR68_07460 [Peptococcaceae bacterium BRH_c4a]
MILHEASVLLAALVLFFLLSLYTFHLYHFLRQAQVQEQEYRQIKEFAAFPLTEPQFRRLRRPFPARRINLFSTSALQGHTAAHNATQAITPIPTIISFFNIPSPFSNRHYHSLQ